MNSFVRCDFSSDGNKGIKIEESRIFIITIKDQKIELSADELEELKRVINTITL